MGITGEGGSEDCEDVQGSGGRQEEESADRAAVCSGREAGVGREDETGEASDESEDFEFAEELDCGFNTTSEGVESEEN